MEVNGAHFLGDSNAEMWFLQYETTYISDSIQTRMFIWTVKLFF